MCPSGALLQQQWGGGIVSLFPCFPQIPSIMHFNTHLGHATWKKAVCEQPDALNSRRDMSRFRMVSTYSSRRFTNGGRRNLNTI
jgi:hypothetical protein